MTVQAYQASIPNLTGFQGGTQTICASPEYLAHVEGNPPEMENTQDNPCRAIVRFNVHSGELGGLSFDALAIVINNTQMRKLLIKDDNIWLTYNFDKNDPILVSKMSNKVEMFAQVIRWGYGGEFRLRFAPPISGDRADVIIPTLSMKRKS